MKVYTLLDLQRYPWNLYLINNVEDIVVFLVLKEINYNMWPYSISLL